MKENLLDFSTLLEDKLKHFAAECKICKFNYATLNARDLQIFLEIRNSSAFFLHDDRIFNISETKEWFKDKRKDYYLTVKLEKKIIGYFRFNNTDKNQIWIGLDLAEKLRGKGIGEKLYLCIFLHSNLLINEGNIMLEVLDFNQRAIKLYRKIGFVEITSKIILRHNIQVKSIKMKLDKSRYRYLHEM